MIAPAYPGPIHVEFLVYAIVAFMQYLFLSQIQKRGVFYANTEFVGLILEPLITCSSRTSCPWCMCQNMNEHEKLTIGDWKCRMPAL